MEIEGRLMVLLREMSTLERFHMERKGSQNRMLQILRTEGAMTQRALTRRAGIRSGSASEVLGKLERAGLILRSPDPADRRTMSVALTDAGRAQAEMQAQRRRAHRMAAFSALSEEEKAALAALLEKLHADWRARAAQTAEE